MNLPIGSGVAALYATMLAWLWVGGWRKGEPTARVMFWLMSVLAVAVTAVMVVFRQELFARGWLIASVLAMPTMPALAWLTGPVSPAHVERVAVRRRLRALDSHFAPAWAAPPPDPDFKSGLDREGALYSIDIELSLFPAYTAQLLKWKKHEWFVVGLASGTRVKALWAHKGADRTRVGTIEPGELLYLARATGADALAILHNHPASEPHVYSYSRPSQADLASAATYAEHLLPHGISLVEYVCERGVAHMFLCHAADALLPLEGFRRQVHAENTGTWWGNARLHLQGFLG